MQKICILSQFRDFTNRSFVAMWAVVVMSHNLSSGMVRSPHAVLMSGGGLFHESYNTQQDSSSKKHFRIRKRQNFSAVVS
jgi:hypothetical protein